MKIKNRGLIAIVTLLLATSLASAERVGKVSAAFGKPTINGKPINITSPIENGDQIVTGVTDSAALLLDSKVVVKVDGDTVLRVVEEKGKTDLKIERGTVQVFLAKRQAAQGPVALTDPDATMEAIGTIFASTYNPGTREGRYAAQESFINVQGNGDPNRTRINTGSEAFLRGGKLVGINAIDPQDLRRRTRNINQLEEHSKKQHGAQLWQNQANRDANNLIGIAMGQTDRPGKNAQQALGASGALTDSRQLHSVQLLSASGAFGATSGIGANASSGGFTDMVVQLSHGSLLNFNIFDSGVEDGDQVHLRIRDSSGNVVNQNITLTNAGQTFSPKVNTGRVEMSVTALNEGSISPNTGAVNVTSTVISGSNPQLFDLSQGETGVLRITAKKPSTQAPASATANRR